MNLRPFIAALVLSSGLLAGIPTAVFAQTQRAVTVRIADLNLSSDAGRRVFEKRLNRAVERACDYDAFERQFAIKANAQQCVAETRAAIETRRIALLAKRIVAKR